jgi:hypothetical protein
MTILGAHAVREKSLADEKGAISTRFETGLIPGIYVFAGSVFKARNACRKLSTGMTRTPLA